MFPAMNQNCLSNDEHEYDLITDEKEGKKFLLAMWFKSFEQNQELEREFDNEEPEIDGDSKEIEPYKVTTFDSSNHKLGSIFDTTDRRVTAYHNYPVASDFFEKHPPYKAVGSLIPWGKKTTYEDHVKEQLFQRSSWKRNRVKMENLEQPRLSREAQQILDDTINNHTCDSPFETMFDCKVCDSFE